MIPGLTAMVLQVQALLLTALAIVRSANRHDGAAGGDTDPLLGIGFGEDHPLFGCRNFNTIATLLVAVYMFGIVIQGSFWLLVLLSTVFILGPLGWACNFKYFPHPNAGHVCGSGCRLNPCHHSFRLMFSGRHAADHLLLWGTVADHALSRDHSRDYGKRSGGGFPLAIHSIPDHLEHRLFYCQHCGVQKEAVVPAQS